MRLERPVFVGLVVVTSLGLTRPAHASGWASALRFDETIYSDADADAVAVDEPAPSEEEDAAEARAAYKAGTREYALGNYELAVSHFERSFELSQRPELLFNIAQSYARWYEISNELGHLRKAERLFKNYVSYLDTDEHPDPAARADAEAAIADVERLIAAHGPEEGTDGRRRDDDRPVHKKAWFWVAIIGGAAVVGGAIAAGVVLSRPTPDDPELGTIGAAGRIGPVPGGLGFSF